MRQSHNMLKPFLVVREMENIVRNVKLIQRQNVDESHFTTHYCDVPHLTVIGVL